MLISTQTDIATIDLLSVIADPLRWHILQLLAEEELCSTHLQDILGVKQTLISHHMKVLREAGLVDTSPCGRFSYFRLRPGAFDDISDAVHALAEAAHRTPARRAC